MEYRRSLLAVALLLLLSIVSEIEHARAAEMDCQTPADKPKSCTCKTVDGQVFDFTSLQTPKANPYVVYDPDFTHKYSYNPCTTTTSAKVPTSTAILQVDEKTSAEVSCGSESSAVGKYDLTTGTITFTFLHGTKDWKGNERSSQIAFKCNPAIKSNPELNFLEELPTLHYNLQMETALACGKPAPTSAPPSHSHAHGLSAGSILIIIFFVLFSVYFAAGIAYSITVKKGTGREVIPNVEFWMAIPGLIKDGFDFLRGKSSSAGYDSL